MNNQLSQKTQYYLNKTYKLTEQLTNEKNYITFLENIIINTLSTKDLYEYKLKGTATHDENGNPLPPEKAERRRHRLQQLVAIAKAHNEKARKEFQPGQEYDPDRSLNVPEGHEEDADEYDHPYATGTPVQNAKGEDTGETVRQKTARIRNALLSKGIRTTERRASPEELARPDQHPELKDRVGSSRTFKRNPTGSTIRNVEGEDIDAKPSFTPGHHTKPEERGRLQLGGVSDEEREKADKQRRLGTRQKRERLAASKTAAQAAQAAEKQRAEISQQVRDSAQKQIEDQERTRRMNTF